jgi:hypothetical protein
VQQQKIEDNVTRGIADKKIKEKRNTSREINYDSFKIQNPTRRK